MKSEIPAAHMRSTVVVITILLTRLVSSCLALTEREVVTNAAKQTVKESLKSPSTAQFVDVTVLEQKGKKYLVRVVLDAQNAYGAMIRGSYIVILTVVDGSHYKDATATEIEEQGMESYTINLAKELYNWDDSSATPTATPTAQESPATAVPKPTYERAATFPSVAPPVTTTPPAAPSPVTPPGPSTASVASPTPEAAAKSRTEPQSHSLPAITRIEFRTVRATRVKVIVDRGKIPQVNRSVSPAEGWVNVAPLGADIDISASDPLAVIVRTNSDPASDQLLSSGMNQAAANQAWVRTNSLEATYQKTRDGRTLVWNNHPKPGDEACWTGGTDANGYAMGNGTLTWYERGVPRSWYTGTMVAGRLSGYVVNTEADGRRYAGTFVNGVKSSDWNLLGTKSRGTVKNKKFDQDQREAH